MRSMKAGSMAAVLASVAMLSLSTSTMRAQQTDDDGRMRAQSEEARPRRRWSLIPGERIAHTRQDGSFIVLRDGTVWEVYLPDRTSTAGWREGDFLMVKQAPLGRNIGQHIFDYELINGRTNERAVVSFRGLSR